MVKTIKRGTLPPSGWEFVLGSTTKIKRREPGKPENNTDNLRDELRSLLTSGLLIGERGERGPMGNPGRNGSDGRIGRDGVDGKDGLNGKDGKNGRNGVNGKRGGKGERGQRGADGRPGKDGIDGDHFVGVDYIKGHVVIKTKRGKEFSFYLPIQTTMSLGGGGSSGGGGDISQVPVRVTAINADHPTFVEAIGAVDNSNTVFTMPDDYIPGTMRVYYKSALQYDFQEGPGANQVTMGFAPKIRTTSPGGEMIFDYEKISS